MTDKAAAQALYDAKVAELNDMYFLVDIDYRDELSDEDCQNLLDGKPEEVEERLEEYISDSRYRGAKFGIELITTEEERDLLDEHGLLDELRFEVQDRDVSDPIGDMLRNTPGKLLTVDLDHDVPDYTMCGDEEFDQILADIAEAAGIELGANRDALAELVGNASYGGRLKVIWYGGVDEALGATRAAWTDPMLLIHGSWNGSGMDARVKGTVTRDLKPGDVRLDVLSPGYSWTKTACPSESAYRTSVEFDKPEN